jgi:hypothetical protein
MPLDEYDDDRDRDEDYGAHEAPRFPMSVRVAGIIWIGFGALGIINVLVGLAMMAAQQGQGGAGAPSSPCCGAFIAFAFLYCGYQTVTGKASDTLSNAIGSLVIGSLQLLIGGILLFGGAFLAQNPNFGGGPNGLPPEALIILAILIGLMGTGLITAGIMALVGRRQYREWREARDEAERPARRRPRRRREESDEDNE